MTYTLEDTKKLLDAQVAKKGEDYVYPPSVNDTGCVYFERDNDYKVTAPSCIVGHVFADIGVDPDDVAEIGLRGYQYESVKSPIVEMFEPKAFDLLVSAQREQDNSAPWGIAVERAYSLVTLP